MNWQKVIPVVVAVCTILTGCRKSPDAEQGPSAHVSNVVTEDIQAGIEKHIEEQTRLGEGYFKLLFGERQLRLKLVRFPVKEASQAHLGVIKGHDEFEFLYRAILPDINDTARMWIPLPATDAFQTVEVKSIKAPGQRRILQDSEYGNKVLFLKLGPKDSGETVEILFQVQRVEKAVYAAQTSDPQKYLNPERLVPANEDFRGIAAKVVEGKTGDLVRARALYDHVIDRMRYMKYGPGWGKGDAVYACDARTGNCTDFHSYFIALSRSVGIPARFAIGAAIPSERNEGGIDGYHCWAEFYTDGEWWPVDISEGDKYSSLSTYYFGHHPANRIEFSRGRDLIVDPGPASGPINFLAYPLLEISGKPTKVKVEFSFCIASLGIGHFLDLS